MRSARLEPISFGYHKGAIGRLDESADVILFPKQAG
jgi:hypothetical protein